MRNYSIYIILIYAGVLASCASQNNKADAFGNFETNEVIVSSEIQGKVISLNVQEGQALQEGAIAGQIDTVQLYLKSQQLHAQLDAVQAKSSQIDAQVAVQTTQKQVLETEIKRVEKLLESGAATNKQLDDVQGQLNISEKQISATKAQFASIAAEKNAIAMQIAQTNDQLARCKIKNPIDGTILEKYINEGEMAIPGKALYKVADLKQMELRVYVSGSQLPQVKLMQKVIIRIDDGKKSYRELEGTISWVSQQAEFTPKIIQTKEERVNLVYAVKVMVINDGSLKIGMPGEVIFNK